jgi:hypothetical protein
LAEINDFDPVDANNIARWPEGMTFANVNNSARADEGILARMWKSINGSLTTTGAANVYAVTCAQTLSAYYTGLWVRAKANFTNSGAATMNFNALGAKALVKENGAALASGDIVNGVIYDFVYDGTNIQVLQLNTFHDGIVTTAKIADGAVTTVKIADLNVTWGKLADTIFNQTPTTPALGDLIPFADVSASNVKAVATVSSILALANPTVQRFTSGSGTYTPSVGIRYIEVEMSGGGGGGGAQNTNSGANGTLSSFGSWTCNPGGGGTGGSFGGGAGGTGGTNGTGTLIDRIDGGDGNSGAGFNPTQGGPGGANPRGGAGRIIDRANGQAAKANTGGGGGAGSQASSGFGTSGGAGEWVKFTMTAAQVGASQSYAVGPGGNGGAAGGLAGGNGAAGIIIVKEYY